MSLTAPLACWAGGGSLLGGGKCCLLHSIKNWGQGGLGWPRLDRLDRVRQQAYLHQRACPCRPIILTLPSQY